MSVTSLQRNGKDYLIGDLSVMEAPSEAELASWGVAEELRRQAPNSNIVWLRGHYVSAGANRNGQMFTAGEIAMKAVTARLQPITVMHRPRDVVGVIADVRLNAPDAEAAAAGEVMTMETVLAVWGHRFPEVADEIRENSSAGMLMQSMEANSAWYDCSECGEHYVKPVDPSQHCEHLTNGSGHRTLGDVTFTGTGLIFGSRGSQGADPQAYLAEVAEWADARSGKDNDDKDDAAMKIEIDKSEYDELKAAQVERDQLKRRVDVDADAKTEAEKVAADALEAQKEAEKTATEAEVKAQDAEEAKAKVEAELAELKEERAADELAMDRLSQLPAKMAEKLPKTTAERLTKKARTLGDEEWTAEVAELAELLDVKLDGDSAGDVFAEQAMRGFNPNGSVTDPKASTSGGITASSVAGALATSLRDRRKGKN